MAERRTQNPNPDVVYEGWPGGINNRMRETERGAGERGQASPFLRSAVNVNLSREGKPFRRDGYQQVYTGNYHSLWRHPSSSFALVVKDGQLTLLAGETPIETTLGPIDPYKPVDYAYLNGMTYFSNGETNGRVSMDGQLLPWGRPVPTQPDVNVITGLGLYEGCYHVSASYVDIDGVEHGASEPVTVDAAEGSGLEITLPYAFPDRIAYAEIFVSQASGETLYNVGQLNAPGTLTVGQAEMGVGRPIETLFKEAPFPGQLVCEFSGRVYVAVGDALFFTDPLRYELVSPETNVILFPQEITLLEPSHDGLYVGYGSAVDFLPGTDPFDMQRRLVSSYGAVMGTGKQLPGHHFDLPLDFVPVWWGQHVGFVLGQPGGQVRLLTENRLATKKFEAGAIITREHEGLTQLIGTLRDPGGSAAVATDSAVAEVRRPNVE